MPAATNSKLHYITLHYIQFCAVQNYDNRRVLVRCHLLPVNISL